MKQRLLTAAAVLVLVLTLVSPVLAASKAPSACPVGYDLHLVGDHQEHADHHIGVAVDLNGNGYLCMKMLSGGLHVHVDDVIP